VPEIPCLDVLSTKAQTHNASRNPTESRPPVQHFERQRQGLDGRWCHRAIQRRRTDQPAARGRDRDPLPAAIQLAVAPLVVASEGLELVTVIVYGLPVALPTAVNVTAVPLTVLLVEFGETTSDVSSGAKRMARNIAPVLLAAP
jgi:hypothetical protein